jgi:hypothetical protein
MEFTKLTHYNRTTVVHNAERFYTMHCTPRYSTRVHVLHLAERCDVVWEPQGR